MNKIYLGTLLNLVQRKQLIDPNSDWVEGSSTYIDELKKEIEELDAEIGEGRPVYLEDELADVLWDYLNLVQCLSNEEGISIEGIISRAQVKYGERISGIEQGRTWEEVKSEQKIRLQEEHRLKDSDA